MALIYRFPIHARASERPQGSAGLAANSASASNVISLRPNSPASRTRATQYGDGIPPGRVRQLLTVGSANESAEATFPVPPSASMMADADCMPDTIVRSLRTRQGFATCELTISADHGPIPPMRDPPEIVGKRLEDTRVALGFDNQAEFAAALDLTKSTYNPYEKGKRPLTLRTALIIQARFHVPINWLLNGDPSQLPHHLHKLLVRAA